jgi:hypothetical protein
MKLTGFAVLAGAATLAFGPACAAPAKPAAKPPAAKVGAASPAGLAPNGYSGTGLPDWTGAWDIVGGRVFDPTAKPAPGVPPEEAREYPPYNAAWEKKYEAEIERHKQGIGDDPLANCTPHGFPRMVGGGGGPIEFIVTPKETWMIWEYMSQIRRIYTDGRPHPPEEQLYPMWMGHSVGHWEGQTLVIDTISLRESVFDRTGAPHSDQIHVTERWTKLADGSLQDKLVVYDPVAFTKPWNVTRRFERLKGKAAKFEDLYCDVQRNPIVAGQTQVVLPGDPVGFYIDPNAPPGHQGKIAEPEEGGGPTRP